MQPQDWTENPDAAEKPSNWAFQLALCLLGPLFFLSVLLSLLTPLPLLYLQVGTPNLTRGRLWALVSLVVGVALSAAIKGWLGAAGFVAFGAVPAMVLSELLLRRKGPELAIGGAILAILVSVALLLGLGKSQGVDLLAVARSGLDDQVKVVAQTLLTRNTEGGLPTETKTELEGLTKNPALIYPELPGIAASTLFLLCLLPVLALIRWNPKGFLRRVGLPRDYLRKWKTPDWLVWIALFCGAFQVFEYSPLTEIAGNVLKPLLLIYFFQGMSILAYFLDSLRLRGPLRIFIYGAGLFFLTPMVVSFGFFDIWFNFRGRHKPPVEDKEP